MELFFDTETSGFYSRKLSAADPNQAWAVQLGMILSTRDFIYHEANLIIKANGRKINPHAEAVHCISVEISEKVGVPERLALTLFEFLVDRATTLVCHNYDFDYSIINAMIARHKSIPYIRDTYCTMKSSTDLCKLPGKYGKWKWPKLQELHKFLFNEEFEDAHDALADVRATRRCYYEMVKESD